MTPAFLFRAVDALDWEELQLDGLLYDTCNRDPHNPENDTYSLTVYHHLGTALRRGLEENMFHCLLAIPIEKYLPNGLAMLGPAITADAAFDLEQAVQVDDVIVPDSLNSLRAVCPTITQPEIDLFYRVYHQGHQK